MAHAFKESELIALRAIAETLNTSNDINQMLDKVLKTLLQVTGLTTGWIFLVGEKPEFSCTVDHNLPPALSWGDKKPMCSEDCWCLSRYWKGTLKHAVNIINCKRIEDAIEFNWGETDGITHHATVPLEAGGEMFGILNVAAPGKNHFDQGELTLLQSIAFQIGTAVNRAKLYHAQQKRADGFEKLGQILEKIGTVVEISEVIDESVSLVEELFDWPQTAVFIKEGNSVSLRALSNDVKGANKKKWKLNSLESNNLFSQVLNDSRKVYIREVEESNIFEEVGLEDVKSCVITPLRLHGEAFGLMVVTSPKIHAFDFTDEEIMEALSRRISLAFENAKLYEQRRELTMVEERNRLARDLHDSVCQTLFSLNLTARASQLMVKGENEDLKDSLQHVQMLTDSALKQMRSLIWQLRPGELEDGLVTALKKYGKRLGLDLEIELNGVKELSNNVEETLWRVGQECLNNISKHAGNPIVTITLTITKQYISMEVRDQGKGFSVGELEKSQSMGMTSMRERIDLLGGTFSITSSIGQGTEVIVTLPLM